MTQSSTASPTEVRPNKPIFVAIAVGLGIVLLCGLISLVPFLLKPPQPLIGLVVFGFGLLFAFGGALTTFFILDKKKGEEKSDLSVARFSSETDWWDEKIKPALAGIWSWVGLPVLLLVLTFVALSGVYMVSRQAVYGILPGFVAAVTVLVGQELRKTWWVGIVAFIAGVILAAIVNLLTRDYLYTLAVNVVIVYLGTKTVVKLADQGSRSRRRQ